ncbi:MAG: hypothetical protein ABI806_00035 [Candidatus Solibacter sp.]
MSFNGNILSMKCTERDHIILAFALAANEKNIAAEEGETANTEPARKAARHAAEMARNFCFTLRNRFLDHCHQHGC